MDAEQVKKKRYKVALSSLTVLLIATIGFITWQSYIARKHTEAVIESIRSSDTIMSIYMYEDSDHQCNFEFEIWNPRNESLHYYSYADIIEFDFTSSWRKYIDRYEYSYDHTMNTWGKHKRLHDEPSNNPSLMTMEQQDLVGISIAYKRSPVKIGFKFKADSKIKDDIACIKLDSFNRNAERQTLFAVSRGASNCAVLRVVPRGILCVFNSTSFEIEELLIGMLKDSYYDKELWSRVGNFLLNTGFDRNRLGIELQSDMIENLSAEPCKLDGSLKECIDIIKDDSIVLFQENESNIVMRHKGVWYSISKSDDEEIVYSGHRLDNIDLIKFTESLDKLNYTKSSGDHAYLSDMAFELYQYTRKTSGGTELHFIDITDFITGESWGVITADKIRDIPEDELDELGNVVLEILEK